MSPGPEPPRAPGLPAQDTTFLLFRRPTKERTLTWRTDHETQHFPWCKPVFDFPRAAAALAQAQAGLVSYWAGEGNANDSVGANSGTLQNGVSFGPGVIGQAFRFDGTSYVEAPTLGLPIGNQNRTLALWFKVENFNTEESFFAGYGNFGTFDAAYVLGAHSFDTFFSQWGTGIGGPAVQAGKWRHLAVTNVGDLATLYLDGADVGSATVPINTSSGSNFYLGRIPGLFGDVRQLDGFVDEVSVYDRALSSSEISQLASVPEPSSLVLAALGVVGLLAARRRQRWLTTLIPESL